MREMKEKVEGVGGDWGGLEGVVDELMKVHVPLVRHLDRLYARKVFSEQNNALLQQLMKSSLLGYKNLPEGEKMQLEGKVVMVDGWLEKIGRYLEMDVEGVRLDMVQGLFSVYRQALLARCQGSIDKTLAGILEEGGERGVDAATADGRALCTMVEVELLLPVCGSIDRLKTTSVQDIMESMKADVVKEIEVKVQQLLLSILDQLRQKVAIFLPEKVNLTAKKEVIPGEVSDDSLHVAQIMLFIVENGVDHIVGHLQGLKKVQEIAQSDPTSPKGLQVASIKSAYERQREDLLDSFVAQSKQLGEEVVDNDGDCKGFLYVVKEALARYDIRGNELQEVCVAVLQAGEADAGLFSYVRERCGVVGARVDVLERQSVERRKRGM